MNVRWISGLIYMFATGAVFMTMGVVIGLNLSDSTLQFLDFVKVVITIWLTFILVGIGLYMAMHHLDDED